MLRFGFAALLLAAAAPLQAQQVQDWNQTYAETGKGHRVGDPDAPVQLVEYLSYTCSACAHYARTSEAALRLGFVGEGKVAVEVRHLIFDRVDLAAALIAECGPPDRFFERHRALNVGFAAWSARSANASPGQTLRWRSGSLAQQLVAIANDLDFYELMEPQGLGEVEINRCLRDPAKAEALLALAQASSSDLPAPAAAPAFAINGVVVPDVSTWEALAPLLSPAE